jgi:predicted RNA methylase
VKIGTEEKTAAWLDALEKRHMASLTFQEVRRGVQALSTIYVEQRGRIDAGAALQGEGKRAGFAMFYSPLHFLLVREIVRALAATHIPTPTILDLGCGTGSAGAAWALECQPQSSIVGLDRNAWAIAECRWTYQTLGLRGTVKSSDIRSLKIPANAAVLAAFTINELDDETRERFLGEFLRVADAGVPVLIVEPIARRLTPWWDRWASAFKAAGGRADEWRFRIDLPEKLKLMDRAAGLNHQELTGRSLGLKVC